MSSIDEDIATFRENSLEATRLQKDGKRTAGNRKRDRSHSAFLRLMETEEGVEALVQLMTSDSDAGVRHDIAGRLLPDQRAVDALEEWASGTGSEAEAARFTLKYLRMSQDLDGSGTTA